MDGETVQAAALQDHAAFKAGTHDFQAEIEVLSNSQLVGTILETVMMATGMRFAAVARVTRDRWVACRTVDETNFGLKAGDEIEIRSTFCQTVRDSHEAVIFNDVATDVTYGNHPIALKFGIASYASFPIYRGDGSFFGTLCVIDRDAREVRTPRAIAMLKMFADIIGQGLEAEERLEAHEYNSEHEQQMAQVQEEFVAVLGHDLRNPVAAFTAGLRQLEAQPQSEHALMVLSLMKGSLRRMNELIDNIMLHARSRLGRGIRIVPTGDAPLAATLDQVIAEISVAQPERAFLLERDLTHPVRCDTNRIAQAASNLLSNAAQHGADGHPVALHARTTPEALLIRVTNRGAAIPDHMRRNLFLPFERGAGAEGKSMGLGLGLYVTHSIVEAHGGTIDVTCADGETAFEIRLPREAAPDTAARS